MKTMFLQFDELEYEVIPSPKRTWVMEAVREKLARVGGVSEVMWAFRIDGRCMKALGRTRTEALGELGYGVKDFERIDRHGPMSEAVADGWWVEEGVRLADGWDGYGTRKRDDGIVYKVEGMDRHGGVGGVPPGKRPDELGYQSAIGMEMTRPQRIRIKEEEVEEQVPDGVHRIGFDDNPLEFEF